MKLKNPQAKGKNFEYHVRDLIRGYGFNIQRSPMSGAISFMKGDLISPDFGWFVECKKTEKTDFIGWYHKAKQQTGSKPPLIVWSKNNEDTYCFLLLSDFLSLLTNKNIIPIKKPQKPQKQSLIESSGLRFSKLSQLHKLPLDKTSKR